MSLEFDYPQFDEQGVKVLSKAGDATNDMMMNITVYRMKAGEEKSFSAGAYSTMFPAYITATLSANRETIPRLCVTRMTAMFRSFLKRSISSRICA